MIKIENRINSLELSKCKCKCKEDLIAKVYQKVIKVQQGFIILNIKVDQTNNKVDKNNELNQFTVCRIGYL